MIYVSLKMLDQWLGHDLTVSQWDMEPHVRFRIGLLSAPPLCTCACLCSLTLSQKKEREKKETGKKKGKKTMTTWHNYAISFLSITDSILSKFLFQIPLDLSSSTGNYPNGNMAADYSTDSCVSNVEKVDWTIQKFHMSFKGPIQSFHTISRIQLCLSHKIFVHPQESPQLPKATKV